MTFQSAEEFQRLPGDVQQAIQALSNRLRTADAIRSAILYGGAARGTWRGVRSDLNLLIIAQHYTVAGLEAMERALTEAAHAFRCEPLYLAQSELQEFAKRFPSKWLDIQRRHLVLFGDDSLSQVSVDRAFLKERTAQEVFTLLLRMRRRYAAVIGNEPAMLRVLSDIARPLAIQLLTLEIIEDKQPTTDSTDDVFERASTVFGLNAEALQTLSHLRNNQTVQVKDAAEQYQQTLRVLEQLVQRLGAT